MSVWDTYPVDYRAAEVRAVVSAAQSGECASVVGLSGSGKSNLLGFLANRARGARCSFALVDCNRVTEYTPEAFFRLIRRALGSAEGTGDELDLLDTLIQRAESERDVPLCLLLDRFDDVAARASPVLFNNMRALRDAHKYTLAYVAATRHPLRAHTELAELFYARTVWLGVLSESDARWTVTRYAARKEVRWDDEAVDVLKQEGIVSSVTYWKQHAVAGEHCSGANLSRLINKIAQRLKTK